MILQFSFENILSINEKETLSFEILDDKIEDERQIVKLGEDKYVLKMASLYGKNGAGKSNLLKAYNFFMTFILHGLKKLKEDSFINIKPFLYCKEFDEKRPSSFDLTFFYDNNVYVYSISLNKYKVIAESLSLVNKNQLQKIYFRNDEGKVSWGQKYQEPKIDIEKMLPKNVSLLNLGTILENSILCDVYNFLLNITLPNIDSSCGSIMNNTLKMLSENEGSKSILLKLLANPIFNSIKDLEIVSTRVSNGIKKVLPMEEVEKLFKNSGEVVDWTANVIHEIEGNEYSIPLLMEAAGTYRFIELFLPLIYVITNPKFLLIDEIEASLNQDLLELFLDAFLTFSKDSQLLFTTHNPDILNSKIIRKDETWFALKSEKGETYYINVFEYNKFRDEE